MTGRPLAFGGDQMLSVRQSSPPTTAVLSGDWLSPLRSDGNCGHISPNASASMTPSAGIGGRGACQRRAPTGGRAKGTPSQARAPLASMNPTTSPDSVVLKVVPSASFGAGGAGRLLMYQLAPTMTATATTIRVMASLRMVLAQKRQSYYGSRARQRANDPSQVIAFPSSRFEVRREVERVVAASASAFKAGAPGFWRTA